MNKIVSATIFCILMVCLLANPAPQSIEIEDLLLIAMPFILAILCLAVSKHYVISKVECDLIIAIMFYCSYLLISILVGFMHGVPLLNILRAIGPYLDFMPLMAICLLPPRVINPWQIAGIFIFIGTLQAGFQLYLYFTHSIGIVDTQGVLRGRITLINPRATLPIILAVTILPFAFFSYKKYSATILILAGLFGGIVTLTRSIMLSIIMGWVLFFVLLFAYQRIHQDRKRFMHSMLQFMIYASAFLILFCLISFIPKIHMLEQGLLARFYSASSSQAADYSNGRLYDEWIPALTTWLNADLVSLLFGIGAGNTFTVATGEERTYIHNLLIYSLVYGGLAGITAWISKRSRYGHPGSQNIAR